jgi:hypothetical protein
VRLALGDGQLDLGHGGIISRRLGGPARLSESGAT